MNNLSVFVILFILSLILSFIRYISIFSNYNFEKDEKASERKNSPWQFRFIEIWNGFVSFFLGGIIGYYFISVRLEVLLKGEALNTGDFVLFFIFCLCLFGHLPNFSSNITKGIEAILNKILGKQI